MADNPDSTNPTTSSDKKYRLLIVEDDFYLNQLYSFSAEKAGFEVISKTDGEEALKEIENDIFDFALIDLMLPKVDGFTLMRRIKSKAENTRIIVITNMESPDSKNEAMAIGAYTYLLKVNHTPTQVIKVVKESINT